MGWSIGFDSNWNRDVGYGVPATCDHPGCNEPIDRGLSYVCGGEPYGGDRGCGLYFCAKHLSGWRRGAWVCARCAHYRKPYTPKPDTPEWIHHKQTDPSWAAWRAEQPIDDDRLLAILASEREGWARMGALERDLAV